MLTTWSKIRWADTDALHVLADEMGAHHPAVSELMAVELELRASRATSRWLRTRSSLRRKVLGADVVAAIQRGSIGVVWFNGLLVAIAFDGREMRALLELIANPAASFIEEVSLAPSFGSFGNLEQAIFFDALYRNCPHLRQLAIVDASVGVLARTELAEHIECLDLRRNDCDEQHLARLITSGRFHKLRTLLLPTVDPCKLSLSHAQLPKLEVMSLELDRIRPPSRFGLNLPTLRHLSLRCHLPPRRLAEDIDALAGHATLETLDIAYEQVDITQLIGALSATCVRDRQRSTCVAVAADHRPL